MLTSVLQFHLNQIQEAAFRNRNTTQQNINTNKKSQNKKLFNSYVKRKTQEVRIDWPTLHNVHAGQEEAYAGFQAATGSALSLNLFNLFHILSLSGFLIHVIESTDNVVNRYI